MLTISLLITAVHLLTAAEQARRMDRIPTVGGKLSLMEAPQGRFLEMHGQPVHSGTRFLSVYRFFRLKGYDALLLRDLTGPIACPVRFRFLAIPRQGKPRLSPEFGHCSTNPTITINQGRIIVAFGPFGTLPPATWAFDAQGLKETD
jgi:hypothetical protein